MSSYACNPFILGTIMCRVGELHVPIKPCSTDAFQIKEKYIQAKVSSFG